MASPEVSLKRGASDLDQSVGYIKVDSSPKTMGPFLKETRMSSKVVAIYAGPNETKFTVHKHLLLPDTLTRYEEIHPPNDAVGRTGTSSYLFVDGIIQGGND